MPKLFIGTSGWVYGHWQGIFYPENLSSKDKLKYFSQYFKTVEVNYSFYHLPRPATYRNWYSQTPEDFLFALKVSRFITHTCLPARQVKRYSHTKRGQGAEGAKKDEISPRSGVRIKRAWKTFIKNALNLKEKLGPILFQFPPSFKATEENIKRLKDFLKLITKKKLRFAFEFRHKSWCSEKIYKLLKKYSIAWVIVDSPIYPKAEEVTADFVYLRMHGSKVLFSSKYTKKELSSLARKIKKWLKQGRDIYVYFNNDAMGYAVENAKELLKLCRI